VSTNSEEHDVKSAGSTRHKEFVVVEAWGDYVSSFYRARLEEKNIAEHIVKAMHSTNELNWAGEVRNMILCIYRMDAPWGWHLEKVLKKNYKQDNFKSVEWVPQFISWYVSLVNRIEAEVASQTSVHIGLECARPH